MGHLSGRITPRTEGISMSTTRQGRIPIPTAGLGSLRRKNRTRPTCVHTARARRWFTRGFGGIGDGELVAWPGLRRRTKSSSSGVGAPFPKFTATVGLDAFSTFAERDEKTGVPHARHHLPRQREEGGGFIAIGPPNRSTAGDIPSAEQKLTQHSALRPRGHVPPTTDVYDFPPPNTAPPSIEPAPRCGWAVCSTDSIPPWRAVPFRSAPRGGPSWTCPQCGREWKNHPRATPKSMAAL